MCISDTPVCTAWEPYATPKAWTLPGGYGTRTVYVWYKDNFGNNNQSPFQASILLGTTPVMVSVTSPSGGTHTNNAAINISGTVYSVANIQGISINGVVVPVIPSGNFSQTVQLSTGANTITTVATDAVGNQAVDSRNVILDQTPPAISLVSPVAGNTVFGVAITVSGTIDETASVTAQVNGRAPLSATVSGLSFSANVSLDVGFNTILVMAIDQAGNISQSSVTVTSDVPLSVTSPPPSVGFSVYTFSGTIHPGSTITITPTNGTGVETGSVIYTSPTTWSCTVGNLALGDNVFSITATSPTGSVMSTTATVNFVPDPAPVPAMNKPVVFTLVAALFFVLRRANGRAFRKEQMLNR
jgi:hypothetical protein